MITLNILTNSPNKNLKRRKNKREGSENDEQIKESTRAGMDGQEAGSKSPWQSQIFKAVIKRNGTGQIN